MTKTTDFWLLIISFISKIQDKSQMKTLMEFLLNTKISPHILWMFWVKATSFQWSDLSCVMMIKKLMKLWPILLSISETVSNLKISGKTITRLFLLLENIWKNIMPNWATLKIMTTKKINSSLIISCSSNPSVIFSCSEILPQKTKENLKWLSKEKELMLKNSANGVTRNSTNVDIKEKMFLLKFSIVSWILKFQKKILIPSLLSTLKMKLIYWKLKKPKEPISIKFPKRLLPPLPRPRNLILIKWPTINSTFKLTKEI